MYDSSKHAAQALDTKSAAGGVLRLKLRGTNTVLTFRDVKSQCAHVASICLRERALGRDPREVIEWVQFNNQSMQTLDGLPYAPHS